MIGVEGGFLFCLTCMALPAMSFRLYSLYALSIVKSKRGSNYSVLPVPSVSVPRGRSVISELGYPR